MPSIAFDHEKDYLKIQSILPYKLLPEKVYRELLVKEIQRISLKASNTEKIIASKENNISTEKWIYEVFGVSKPCATKLSSAEVIKSDELENLISSSKWITQLEDDWDDEGGQGYSIDTWERATHFLRKQVEVLEDDFCCIPVPLPQVAPADKGSIDLHWSFDDRQLLVNIPSDFSNLATYFGENSKGETVAGKFDPGHHNFTLAAWLNCEI
jgi:hypothetical protein